MKKGELLKRKAEEHDFIMIVIIWNEILSGEVCGMELPSLKYANDKATVEYFDRLAICNRKMFDFYQNLLSSVRGRTSGS